MENIAKKQRLPFWDNTKAILIIFVVLGHFLDSLTESGELYRGLYIFIYSFHMPMFLFVSGLFTKYTNGKRLRVDKVIFYFIFGYIFKACQYLVQTLAGDSSAVWSWFETTNAPWYMFVLGGYLLLSYFIKNVSPKIVLPISLAISLGVGYLTFIGEFLVISKFIVFFPFFYFGFILTPAKVEEFLDKRIIKIGGYAILGAFALACLLFTKYVYAFRPVFSAWRNYTMFPIPYKFGIALRAFQYVASPAIMLGIFSIIPRKEIKPLTRLGTKTLSVYFWHYLIIKPIGYLGAGVFLTERFGIFGLAIWLACGIITSFVTALPPFEKPITLLQELITKLYNKAIKKD